MSYPDQCQFNFTVPEDDEFAWSLIRSRSVRVRSLQRQVTEWWNVVLSQIVRAELMLRPTDNELDWSGRRFGWPPTPIESSLNHCLSLSNC